MDVQPRNAGLPETAGTVEQRLAVRAARHHGVVSRSEAVAAGVTRTELEHRIKIGYLIRMHRGIYRLGHEAPSALASYAAATMAGGVGCGLSGLAAAHLLGLMETRPEEIEVTCPASRDVPGLVTHRARDTRLRLMHVRGIPVVTPAWALLDIAGRLDEVQIGRACHQAWVRYRLQPRSVAELLDHRGAVKGGRELMRILRGDDPLLLSKLESAYVSLLQDERRQLPATNTHQREGYVDCRWPGLKLVVELDSYRFHGSRQAWERDRERDRAARARGEELIRYTAYDVFDKPGVVRAEARARIPEAG
jgi:hypothetical protein